MIQFYFDQSVIVLVFFIRETLDPRNRGFFINNQNKNNMIIKSDDSFNIPFGYLQLKDQSGNPLDGIYVGIIAVLYQFKGIYRTNIKDLATSFKITEDDVIRRLDWLDRNDLVKVDNIKGQLLLTHGETYKNISDAAYSKRASFARKMRGNI